ncbi:MAG: tyrosine recombinase [Elusimicrobia bacterium]|nr:tyrosine recombinase [Elusimicrobiota bacterium]
MPEEGEGRPAEAGRPPSPGDWLLAEFSRHLALERGLSKNTCAAYLSDLRAFLDWLGERDPLKADPALLDDFLWREKSEKSLSPASLFRRMESLRAFYRFQAAEERVADDPTRDFRAPRLPRRLPDALSEAEMRTLLSAPDDGAFHALRAKTLLELLYATGIRASEALALKPEYVNLSEGWVRVMGKGAKERLVPMHERAARLLARYLAERERRFGDRAHAPQVFLGRGGKALSRVQLWRDLAALAKRAGLGRAVHPHLFRHTFATHLIRGGADARSVQEMLGHASLQTTQIYTHLDAGALKRAHKKHHPRG